MGHLALLSLGFLTLPLDASKPCHSWWLQMASGLRGSSDLLVSYVCVCVMPFFRFACSLVARSLRSPLVTFATNSPWSPPLLLRLAVYDFLLRSYIILSRR